MDEINIRLMKAEDFDAVVGIDGKVLAAPRGKAPRHIQDLMKSQKIAPDLLDKGVHFNVGRIELRAVPNHTGRVSFKAVHPGMASKNVDAFGAAVRQAEEALSSPHFRHWLAKHAQKGFELASPSGNAKALEFKFLLRALGRIE